MANDVNEGVEVEDHRGQLWGRSLKFLEPDHCGRNYHYDFDYFLEIYFVIVSDYWQL